MVQYLTYAMVYKKPQQSNQTWDWADY